LQRLNAEIASKGERIRELDELLKSENELLKLLDERIQANKSQYELFELFMAMLVTSPSVGESAEALGRGRYKHWPLQALGVKIQELAGTWWMSSTESTPAQQRAFFSVIVMGGYLHSIRCGKCEASFIVNKASYPCYCPACASSYTFSDDRFFDLMVSPELGKKLQDVRLLLDEAAKTDLETLLKKQKLADSLPDGLYKALSEGRKIKWEVLNGTDQGKEL